MHSVLLFLSLLLSLRSQTPPPSILYNGNPPNMDLTHFTENVDIPETVFQCPYSLYSPDANGIWNFTQIAHAFFEFGIKPWNFPNPTNPFSHISDCVAALVIVSGECQEPAGSQLGCSIQTGASGVFQTDFLRTVPGFPNSPGYVMNLCLSAYGAGYMAAPFLAAKDKTCTLSFRKGAPASLYNCYKAKATVNEYSCPDPNAVKGVSYNNFIGPFCHKAGASRWSACSGCCTLFNGGGNSYQSPFPTYYFQKAQIQRVELFENFCREAASIKLK